MQQTPDIEIAAHVKLVELIYAKYTLKPSVITYLKKQVLRTFGIDDPNKFILDSFEDRVNSPKKGQYINAFIEMGFTHQTIGEWFEMTPAAVSWHKMNPPKKVYVNPFIKAFWKEAHTATEEIEKEYNNYHKT